MWNRVANIYIDFRQRWWIIHEHRIFVCCVEAEFSCEHLLQFFASWRLFVEPELRRHFEWAILLDASFPEQKCTQVFRLIRWSWRYCIISITCMTMFFQIYANIPQRVVDANFSARILSFWSNKSWKILNSDEKFMFGESSLAEHINRCRIFVYYKCFESY